MGLLVAILIACLALRATIAIATIAWETLHLARIRARWALPGLLGAGHLVGAGDLVGLAVLLAVARVLHAAFSDAP